MNTALKLVLGNKMIQRQATEAFSVSKTTNEKTAHMSDAHITKILITFLVIYNVSDLS